jgi:hypothetical protein
MKALFYLGPRSIALMAAAIISAFASSGRADNGTASYLDFNGSTAGFGTPTGTISYSGSVWSTASDGTATLTTPVDSAQLTFVKMPGIFFCKNAWHLFWHLFWWGQ